MTEIIYFTGQIANQQTEALTIHSECSEYETVNETVWKEQDECLFAVLTCSLYNVHGD